MILMFLEINISLGKEDAESVTSQRIYNIYYLNLHNVYYKIFVL